MSDQVHIVQRGDTLWGISRHYKVDMSQLIALNNLQGGKQHSLQIGQKIKLPADGEAPDTELTLLILDLSFRPIARAKLKLEYDGGTHEITGDAAGRVGPISIEDHAKGIKVQFRNLDGQYSLIADHKTLPLGRKQLTLTSRRMLVRGNYLSQQGNERKTTPTVRREVSNRNPDPHIQPGQPASPSPSPRPVAPASAPKKSTTPPTPPKPEPGLLDQAQQVASDALAGAGKMASGAWDWMTGSTAATPKKPPQAAPGSAPPSKTPPTPVLMQTRVEGGQPTQVVGALFAEANLKLRPANEKYRKVIIDVAKRHGMAPQALAAVINAEAAKARGTGEWLANSQASTSSAAGLTQFLDASWLELATESRSLLNQKLKRDNGYEQVNPVYAENRKGERYLDYIYGKKGDQKLRIDPAPVLQLRFEPEYSIDAGAVYALKNLEIMSKSGIHSAGLPSEDLAKLMYVAHHEGAGGAIKVIKGTLTEDRAAELLPKQVPDATRRAALLARFDNDHKKAYIHWLFTYTDTMIDVRDFMVNPGTFTPKTTSQIAVAVTGDAAAAPAARPAPRPAASTARPAAASATPAPPSSSPTAGPAAAPGLSAVAWRNPLDHDTIRSAGLASWRGATFGMVRSGGKRAHQGVDLVAVPGTAIYAVGNGKVVSVYSGFSDTEGFGATVVLCVDVNDLPAAQKTAYLAKRPEDKVVYFAYCHLSSIDVAASRAGTPVTAGTKLGETGESGNAKGMSTVAKGAHLHFEVRYQHPLPAGRTGLNYRVDPRPFLLNVPDPS